MKRFKTIHKFLTALVAALVLSACGSDFLDINVDPNNPSDANPALILPAAQTGYVSATLRDVNRAAAAFVDQIHHPDYGRWNMTESHFNNAWRGFYAEALQDLEVLIEKAETLELKGYSGAAKLQKAYVYSLLVDMWGDVPFSEALKTDNPRYDSGEAIYEAVFELIDEGLADLQSFTPNPVDINPLADVIYQGNINKWMLMGNSLKLKLHLQMRKVDAAASASAIESLIAGGMLISNNADDFQFSFGSGIAPQNAHPRWINDYNAGSRAGYFANHFLLKMIGSSDRRPEDYQKLSPTVQYGVRDPRLRYYFFRQVLAQPEGSPNIPCEFNQLTCNYYYTGNGYLGRDRGDNSVTPADVPIATKWGVYPVGGIFDADNAKVLTVNDGTGQGIHPMITHFMVKFMLAEAALVLGTTGNPRALLEQGMRASVEKVMAFGESRDNVPAAFKPTQEDIDMYVEAVLAKYDAADDEGKLEVIIDQAYVANFGNGIESYNAYRRTGYPLLQPVIENNEAGPFPRRLIYVVDEIGANTNVPEGSKIAEPVFWDK